MARYAEGTSVAADRSQEEIRRLLMRAGATHLAFGEEPQRAMIQFALAGRHYRFEVRRPTLDQVKHQYRDLYAPQVNWPKKTQDEWKRRWRARVLWIKAQIEFAEVEPDAFAEAMLAHLVLPDGRTLGGWAAPQIDSMYEHGGMPPLLSDGRG